MKPKRVNKTKEQIIAELKGNQKFQDKLKFVKEQFYPALCKASKSIDDAQQNLSIINTLLMEKFLERMKDVKMLEINLYSKLVEGDKFEELSAMLKLFDDMSVFDAKDSIEGMKQEISLFLNEENKERKLETLKTKWIDESLK